MSDGWTPSSPCAPPTAYLPLAGGTMTGPLILAADPIQPLEAVTKQYADAIIAVVEDSVAIGDNRIINGDMRIDQRNNGAAVPQGVSLTYVIDRWSISALVGSSKFTSQRVATTGTFASGGYGYYLLFISTSAYTAPATETYHCQQPIEADYIVDFMWGSATAQPVTLSFWTLSTLTGTFSGCLTNGTRSYPFTFSIPLVNIWTKIAVTIPGDTAGVWTLQGNGTGLYVRFNLGAGANFLGPANAWASANYVGASGSVGIVATSGANFRITGVKLEIGTLATPFNRYSLAKSLADCERYYFQDLGSLVFAFNSWAAAGFMNIPIIYPTSMRAAATVTLGTVSGDEHHVSKCGATYFFALYGEHPSNGGWSYWLYNWRIYRISGALTMTYTLTAQPDIIVRDEDGAFIPTDEANMD